MTRIAEQKRSEIIQLAAEHLDQAGVYAEIEQPAGVEAHVRMAEGLMALVQERRRTSTDRSIKSLAAMLESRIGKLLGWDGDAPEDSPSPGGNWHSVVRPVEGNMENLFSVQSHEDHVGCTFDLLPREAGATRFTKAQAVNLAAHLVLAADPEGSAFRAAIQEITPAPATEGAPVS